MSARVSLAHHLLDYFDAIAPVYEGWAGGLHGRAAVRLVDWVGVKEGDHCLDVGTGTGLVAGALAQRLGGTGEVVAIDPAPEMLSQARRHCPPSIRFVEMWAERLVFKDRSFDLVTYGQSLAYLINPNASLAEARRVMRPGARIAVSCQRRSLSTPAQEVSFTALRAVTRTHGVTVPRHTDSHSTFGEPDVLSGLLEKAGFHSPKVTEMVTGRKARSTEEWIDMLQGLGPFTHALISTMGPVMRRTLGRELEKEMEPLGEEAFRFHHSFIFAAASL